MKQIWMMILLVFACGRAVSARTLVFPLQVDGKSHLSWQWLGRAFSYYLSLSLELNQEAVFRDDEIHHILQEERIRFPYTVTKATAVFLAQRYGASRLVWGNIEYDGGDASQIRVNLSLIDLTSLTSRPLPSTRGHFRDLFQLLRESFGHLLKASRSAPANGQVPALRVSPAGFEQLIKGLLVNEPEKRLELLDRIATQEEGSDYVLWETARAYMENGDFTAAEKVLQKLRETVLFKDRRDFFLAYAALASGQLDLAASRFQEFSLVTPYRSEVANNLGAIALMKGDFPRADAYFQEGITRKRCSESVFNLVLLRQRQERFDDALRLLVAALEKSPEEDMLLRVFCRILVGHPAKETLVPAFESFIPGDFWKQEERELDPLLLSPLESRQGGKTDTASYGVYVEARNFFLENRTDAASEQINQALDLNPFVADYHYLLSMIHLQQKRYDQAETAIGAAVFLKPSEENRQLLEKIRASRKDAGTAKRDG